MNFVGQGRWLGRAVLLHSLLLTSHKSGSGSGSGEMSEESVGNSDENENFLASDKVACEEHG